MTTKTIGAALITAAIALTPTTADAKRYGPGFDQRCAAKQKKAERTGDVVFCGAAWKPYRR